MVFLLTGGKVFWQRYHLNRSSNVAGSPVAFRLAGVDVATWTPSTCPAPGGTCSGEQDSRDRIDGLGGDLVRVASRRERRGYQPAGTGTPILSGVCAAGNRGAASDITDQANQGVAELTGLIPHPHGTWHGGQAQDRRPAAPISTGSCLQTRS
jgi:hypothetical protein